jgi:ABC-type antimicrobial peptide transport system permease subunit
MAFTVTQRTREIAIRRAVGASAARVIVSVFTRAFGQLLLGVVLGCLIAIPVMRDTLDEGPRTLVIVGTLLVVSGLGSCLVPIPRALRVQPSQAIKMG